jgi:hypothetical protein
MRLEVETRAADDDPDTAHHVNNILGSGFAETLGSLDAKGSIENVIDAVSSILARPWFQRVWTQQEQVLAISTDVLLGDHSIDWNMLVDADMFCLTTDLSYGHGTGRCASLDTKKMRREDTSIDAVDFVGTLASGARASRATDPRDKIYGWQGLLRNDQERFLIEPDYTIGVEEVYTRFTYNSTKELQSLIVLALCNPAKFETLPSWVPNFSYNTGQEQNLGHLEYYYKYCKAAADPQAEPRPGAHNSLMLKGKVIDIIRATSVSWDTGHTEVRRPWSLDLVLTTWAAFAKKCCHDPYPTTGESEALADVFWRTLM